MATSKKAAAAAEGTPPQGAQADAAADTGTVDGLAAAIERLGITQADVFAWRPYADHVTVVTRDGRKLRAPVESAESTEDAA